MDQEFLRASFASSVLQCFGRSLWQADSFKCLGLQPGVFVSSRKGSYLGRFREAKPYPPVNSRSHGKSLFFNIVYW